MYKLLLFFPLSAPVQTYVNAFAAKSALSAFPFPGKIHPILPAFLITRTSSGTAQKPGDFFSLPAGTAVRFSSSGRTCLPSICPVRSQAARHLHRVFLPQRPRHCGLAAARKFGPCNFIPASPPCPAPSFCTHFKTAKGHLLYQLQGEVVKKIAKETQIGYNIK